MAMTLSGTTGIVEPAAAAPAFSAYQSSSQTISGATFTKIQCNVEEFDTNSNYDNATNYRFTPTVAGYYQVSGNVSYNPTATPVSITLTSIFKNGARFKDGSFSNINSAQGGWSAVSCLMYFNGTTDYAELFSYMAGPATLTTQNSFPYTYFQAAMVRSA